VPGTALAGSDYQTRTATLTFGIGVTQLPFVVNIVNNTTAEPTEQFTVVLSNPSGATIADRTGVVTILDNDGPAIAAPAAVQPTGAPALATPAPVSGPGRGQIRSVTARGRQGVRLRPARRGRRSAAHPALRTARGPWRPGAPLALPRPWRLPASRLPSY
jgi:hypothetical protein